MSKHSPAGSGSQARPCLEFGHAPAATGGVAALTWTWTQINPDRFRLEKSVAASPFIVTDGDFALGTLRTATPTGGSGYYRVTGVDSYGDSCTDPSNIVHVTAT